MSQTFLLLDGSDHQRLRRTVAPLFSPSAVASRSDEIRTAAELILEGTTKLDAVSGYADELPLRLTGRWLGIDPSHQAVVRKAGKALTGAVDAPVPTNLRHTLRYVQAVMARRVRPVALLRAVSALVRVAKDRFAKANEGHVAPGAMFLEVLQNARLEGTIDDDEALATWILLLIAGYETTANLIGTALYHLIERPALLETVRSDPSRISAVIEETLRFDGPVPVTARVATENIELPSGPIGAGETVIVAMIAANRDPDVFEDPNTFCIDRDNSKHLGFAHGAHFCIGANLARAEARAGIETILERTPVANGTAHWREAFGTRGISHLPITLTQP